MASLVFAVPVFDKWLLYAPLRRVAALVEPPEAEPLPHEGPVGPRFLGLVPTRACNLSCVHCGFGTTPCGEQMDLRLAEDNVEQLAETVDWFSEEFRPCSIDFEKLQPTPESERAGLRPPDPYRFAANFLSPRRVASGRGVEPVYAAAVTDKPRCEDCFCCWSCAGGCHVNHSHPGCSLSNDLVADRAEMQRLALRPSDRLQDSQRGAGGSACHRGAP